MSLPNVYDFIEWGLRRAKRASVPNGAKLIIPNDQVGSEGEWEYFFGTTGVLCSPALIEERWRNYYSKQGWTETDYARATANHVGKIVCDCNGVLDKYRGEDKNASYTYLYYSTDKGLITDIKRDYVIGEAVFRKNNNGVMIHIGWVCGFMPDGDPLIMEERGLWYGFVITKLSERIADQKPFTNRGLMTKIFDYTLIEDPAEPEPADPEPVDSEPIAQQPANDNKPVVFAYVSPMLRGDNVRLLQQALNVWGYTDDQGDPLIDDGKCGRRTIEALAKFIKAHKELAGTSEPLVVEPVVHQLSLLVDGVAVYEGEVT